jgi:hypothetical protein
MAQNKALKEVLAYSQPVTPKPWDQKGIALECCERWGIPFVKNKSQ